MSPLPVTSFSLASSLGHGVDAAVEALTTSTSGLRRNDFLDCALDTYIGRVEGIETEQYDASHVAVEVG